MMDEEDRQLIHETLHLTSTETNTDNTTLTNQGWSTVMAQTLSDFTPATGVVMRCFFQAMPTSPHHLERLQSGVSLLSCSNCKSIHIYLDIVELMNFERP